MDRYGDLTGQSLEVCLERILENIIPVSKTINRPIKRARGLIVAEDIYAGMPVPPFSKSAMDGYAVKASDVEGASEESPVELSVIGELSAGDPGKIEYSSKSAVRIMTGARIPDGFDAVVKQEDTDFGEENVAVFRKALAYDNYCKKGEELKAGELVIKKGTRLGRIELGLLSSLGISKVPVKRPLKIAIVSTGSELRNPGEPLLPGSIYSSIPVMLRCSIEGMGFKVSYDSVCADDKELIMLEIKKSLKTADMLITTGGISVGKKDLLPEVFKTLGVMPLFSNARVQPGAPTAANIYEEKLILSLSGNPYAALANFDFYFPYIASKFMGSEAFLPEEKKGVLADSYEKTNEVRRLVRARYSDGKVYLPVSSHKSSVIGNMSLCNCYIDLEEGRKVSVGDDVTVRLI
ncbi:MAG: molybdopterin molybdotransferase MoeA [Lachnospiraceae bacterium]|nr:molybdopterin molybdotransferase MoeA [Lachnospiraceae bacterium]